MTPVFALAFDHRNSFRRDFMRLGGAGVPTPAQHAAMVAAKAVVVDALLAAVPEIDAGTAVLLIDHEYGGELVPKAQAGGVLVALPVEESGRAELRYLDDGHPERVIDAYHPDYVKVLIRYNPGGDTAMNARQRARLRDLARAARRPASEAHARAARPAGGRSARDGRRTTASGSTASCGRR